MKNNIEMLSYCGLYCGACPSYHRGTCFGCRSEDNSQKRTSKWGCKIRKCCLYEKEVIYCGDCTEFPCGKISKKLIDSHPKDPKFTYRHEIPNNIKKLKNLGFNKWIEREKLRWKCGNCDGTIAFYDYKCVECNTDHNPHELNREAD